MAVSCQARASFPAAPESAAAARRFVRRALIGRCADHVLCDATLLTGEAVTNVLVHAGSSIEVTCSLESVEPGGNTAVRVEVTDSNRTRLVCEPVLVGPLSGEAVQEHGLGLVIVDQLAESWGVTYRGSVKTLWFRCALSGAESPRETEREALHELAEHLGDPALSGCGVDRVLKFIQETAGADAAYILRADEDPDWLLLTAGVGSLREPHPVRIPAEGVFATSGISHWPVVFDDLAADHRHTPEPCVYPRRSLVIAKLTARGRVIGLLAVDASEPGRFGEHAALFVQQAANLAADPLDQIWLAERAQERVGWVAFLAEAGSMLAGITDADDIAVLVAMLVVPRIGDWCAVYLADEAGPVRLAGVWHKDEESLGPLRAELKLRAVPSSADSRADRPAADPGPAVHTIPLRHGTRWLGAMLVGGTSSESASRGAASLLDDLGHRAAVALDTCRRYSREATTSQILQQSLRPAAVGEIPGIESSVIYEPADAACDVGGDFYDIFQASPDRWCLVLGDVCGNGPEAAAITGAARNIVRLLARDGHGPAAILARLNRAIIDDCAPDRFLSMLCAEISPLPIGGARLMLASAGHPLPLLLRVTGQVDPVGGPQLLLGIDDDPGYQAHVIELAPGDVLTCVTDGVTERSDGVQQLDDNDGLARRIAGCAGLSASAIAERIRVAVREFAGESPHDDVAAIVLRVRPHPAEAALVWPATR